MSDLPEVTFTLTPGVNLRLAAMADYFEADEGELVRDAIDALFNARYPEMAGWLESKRSEIVAGEAS